MDAVIGLGEASHNLFSTKQTLKNHLQGTLTPVLFRRERGFVEFLRVVLRGRGRGERR